MARSFVPMKRKMFDQPNNGQLLEHPPSKRLLMEESVASHLEHLKLSPSSSPSSGCWDVQTPGGRDALCRSPPQLNIKTVSSCPHSTERQVSRKRYFRDYEGHRAMGSWSVQSNKRMRLDPEIGTLSNTENGNRTNHRLELNPCQHNSAMLTPAHGFGSMSSIPEEAEPSPSGRLSLSPDIPPAEQPPWSGISMETPVPSRGCDISIEMPPAKGHDIAMETPSCGSGDPDHNSEKEQLQSLSFNLLSAAFLSPSPTPPPLLRPPPSPPDVSIGCSVWVAPEIQTIKAASLLPSSVVEEIKSTGMKVVPWVGMDAVLQGRTLRQKDATENDEQTQEVNSQTTPVFYHSKDCEMDDFSFEP